MKAHINCVFLQELSTGIENILLVDFYCLVFIAYFSQVQYLLTVVS